eukprot:NODE_396_length_8125_cov_0.508472.p6 type:complete len:152 gc:universal NODE_396_length_8125_cov_0.508472:5257-4802(-)
MICHLKNPSCVDTLTILNSEMLSTRSLAATLNQCIRGIRKSFPNKPNSPALNLCPQKKAVITQILIQSPKKPNSANRKVARVRLSTGRSVLAYIPGIGHSLQEHAVVLIRGKGPKDLPGVNYTVCRGTLDCVGVEGRITSRSKYGAKRPKK